MSFKSIYTLHLTDSLGEAPDKHMPMAELVRQLQKQFARPESTLYLYIGKMDSIERIEMPDSHKKVCRLKEKKGTINKGNLRERVGRSVQVILTSLMQLIKENFPLFQQTRRIPINGI